MRLVFITQTLDAEHPALAQTLDLVAALAARVDELVVLCQSVGSHPPLPSNVRVCVFGAGSRAGRAVSASYAGSRPSCDGDRVPMPCSRTWSPST